MYRVGGDFEIDLNLLVSPKKRELEEITNSYSNHIWTDTGRSALFLAIEAIENRLCEKVVYMPSFSCDSVIQPFKEKGFNIQYYSMGEDLVSPTNLPFDLTNKVFLYINYFGIENKVVKDWLIMKRSQQSFYIIEDCVQAAFSTFSKEIYDYKVFSYRKFTSQPDGALLISKEPVVLEEKLGKVSESFILDQVKGKILRSFSVYANEYLPLLKRSENSLSEKVLPRNISDLSVFFMERFDFDYFKRRRQENWMLLMNLFNKNRQVQIHIKPLFENKNDNEIPLGFPVIVKSGDRDSLRDYLVSKNIFCPIHWEISNNQFEVDKKLSRIIMTIPIDHRMDKEHVNYTFQNIVNYYLEEK